jgi:hypothetical protein
MNLVTVLHILLLGIIIAIWLDNNGYWKIGKRCRQGFNSEEPIWMQAQEKIQTQMQGCTKDELMAISI